MVPPDAAFHTSCSSHIGGVPAAAWLDPLPLRGSAARRLCPCSTHCSEMRACHVCNLLLASFRSHPPTPSHFLPFGYVTFLSDLQNVPHYCSSSCSSNLPTLHQFVLQTQQLLRPLLHLLMIPQQIIPPCRSAAIFPSDPPRTPHPDP